MSVPTNPVVLDLAVAPRKRAPMEQRDNVVVTREKGILGDARGHFPGRQVTLLFQDAWNDACRVLGEDLPWTTRRANILVGGMDAPREKGARLKLGRVVLEVTEETEPCMIMERAAKGLRKALASEWRGGVCCIVVEPGEIMRGDPVSPAAGVNR